MSDLTYQDVLRILKLIDASTCTNFELESNGTRIKVERNASERSVSPQASALSEPSAPDHKEQLAPDGTDGAQTAKAPESGDEFPGATTVNAPMIGIFYEAPAPGKPAFVEVGSEVRRGDQLGIIEVMKLFTPITAPCDGVVVSILVENQQTVEKDAVLMLLDPK